MPRARDRPAPDALISQVSAPWRVWRAVTRQGAHAALRAWCAANGRAIGAHSLEIYGDWSDDPSTLETTIQYLLR
jgi:hypothetical protein